MARLDADLVDPRDQRWELSNPRYRVYFWRRSGGGYASREFEIAEGEVVDVLAWADEHRGPEESFTLFVVVDRGDGLGLVRLAGSDPTRTA